MSVYKNKFVSIDYMWYMLYVTHNWHLQILGVIYNMFDSHNKKRA